MANVVLKTGGKFCNPLRAKHTSLRLSAPFFVRENSNNINNNYPNSLKSSKSTVLRFSKSNVLSPLVAVVQQQQQKSSENSMMTVGGGMTRDFHTDRSLRDIFTIQDEKDFKAKVENSKKPVIVQFHATWCGPCKLLKPRLEKNLVKYADKVHLALVDIDDLPEIAMRHNVGAVPSVMAIKNGEVFNKFVGLKDDDQIDKFLQESSK